MSSRVTLHAVDGEEVAVEHVPLLQVLDGRDAVGLDQHALPAHLLAIVVGELARAGADVGELVLALGDVAHDLEAALARQLADRLVEAAGHGVGRVRRQADLDARGRDGLRVVEPPHHVGHGLVEARVVDAEDLEVDAAAQAGGSGRLQRRRAVAGVGDGGDAGGHGLDGAQPGAHQVLLRSQRRLDVDEADDPVAELGVVEDAAERRVLDVAVTVDEARHDDGATEVDGRRLRIVGRQPRRGADRHDALAGHGDAPVGKDGRGHREDPVGTVDRDVAVGIGHEAFTPAGGARKRPPRRRSIGEPRAQWQTEAVAHEDRFAAVYSPHQIPEDRSVQQGQGPSISPDVVTSAVWDAVKELPGVCDLHRNPLQSLGEKVHLERHGPVRLDEDDAGPAARDPPGRGGRRAPHRRRRGRGPRRRHLPHPHDRQPHHPRRGAHRRHRRPFCVSVRAIDLTAASSDLLASCCSTCVWWLARPGAEAGPGLRAEWQREAEAEAGFFGRALVDGDAVIGWMHVASSRLTPRARVLPAGPPSPDAYVLTCCVLLRRGVPARLPLPAHGDRGGAQTPQGRGAGGLRPAPHARRRRVPRLLSASSTSSTRTCSRAAASGPCRRRARWRATVSTSRR